MQQTSAGVDAPRVHIITDSASDLVQGELEGISAVVPLSIAFGDEEYLDGVTWLVRGSSSDSTSFS